MMEFFLRISIVVGASIALGFSYLLYSFLSFKFFSKKYPNYDRDFTSEEEVYFSQSAQSIRDLYASPLKFPKWYSWFLYTAYVPTMLLTWFLAFIVWVILAVLAKRELKTQYPDALMLETADVGLSAFFILFACIFFAGWMLYFVSGFSKRMALFVPMKSNIHGFDQEAVRESHIARLEHSIRKNANSINEPFSAKVFIRNKNLFYTRLCGWLGLIILLPGLVFAIFDLRQFTAVTSEGLFQRASYISRDVKKLNFNELDIVKFRCKAVEGGVPHINYDLFLGDEKIFESKKVIDKIDAVYELDKKLRTALVEIRPYIITTDDEEKYSLDMGCLETLKVKGNSDKVETIFHVADYLDKVP